MKKNITEYLEIFIFIYVIATATCCIMLDCRIKELEKKIDKNCTYIDNKYYCEI